MKTITIQVTVPDDFDNFCDADQIEAVKHCANQGSWQQVTGEPVGYAYANQDLIGSVIGAKGEWAPNFNRGDTFTGMSLRDYFAAKAMQGLVDTIKGENWASITARQAYKVAEAMMAAREKS